MAVSEDPEVKQENAHLKEIEELIFDQDVILSYKKVSKILDLHVNKAKRLLSLFVENIRRGKRVISVTYLVSGKEAVENSDGAWRVRIVSEAELLEAKKQFTPESLSSHVYSVHQGTTVLDKTALVEAGKLDSGSSGHSAIVNKNAKPYDQERMQEMARKAQPTVSVQATTSMFGNKKPAPKKQNDKSSPPKVNEEKEEDNKAKDSETEKKSDNSKPAGGTISAMFSAQSSKTADSNSKPAASKPAANSKKGGKKGAGSGNIASFFQRQKDSPPAAKKTPENSQDSSVSGKSEVKESDNSQQTDSQSSTIETKSPVTNSKAKSSSKVKPASKRPAPKSKNNKKETETSKKRKRIIALSDSESSDNEEPEVEMQVDSPPPPVSIVEDEDEPPKPETDIPNSGTYKERRLVDKVYQDEKGFIVTKKEWVVETHKVDEDVTEVKQDTKKESPKKEKTPPAPKKKVQSDIMSFFGRK